MKRFIVTSSLLACMWSTIAVGDPIPPIPPGSVTGKEYSNDIDINSLGVADPHQVLTWGPANTDTFDYTGTGSFSPNTQVDALANSADLFFNEVTTDAVTMLLSFTGVGDIHWTAAGHHGGSHAAPPKIGIWAAGPVDINSSPAHVDVDGLEVWGADLVDDADNFSLIGDPGGVAVWKFDGIATSVPFISSFEIATAIGRPALEQEIDLDAMMVFDNRIMFSIAPISVPVDGLAPLDGGEIWVHTIGAGLAPFLVHGGEVWDTVHVVAGAAGGHFPGVGDENINALEAVPEPGTLALLAVGGLMLARRRR